MSANTVCRVCLTKGLKLHGVRNELWNVFEKLTREKFHKVGYPQSMCYICLSALRKCHKFMETALETNDVLKEWYIFNQQTDKAPKPLFVYSVSKVDIFSIESESPLLKNNFKNENFDADCEKPRPEYILCTPDADISKTITDEQTNTSDFSINSPTNPYDDFIEDYDRQSDPLSSSERSFTSIHKKRGKKKKKSRRHGDSPKKKRKIKETKHFVPEESEETTYNILIDNNNTPLKLKLVRNTSKKSSKTQSKVQTDEQTDITDNRQEETVPNKEDTNKQEETVPNKEYTNKQEETVPNKEYTNKQEETVPNKEYTNKQEGTVPKNEDTLKNVSPSKAEPIPDTDPLNCKSSKLITTQNPPIKNLIVTNLATNPTFALINQNNTAKLIKVVPIQQSCTKFDLTKKDSPKLIQLVQLNTIHKNIINDATLKNQSNLSKLSINNSSTNNHLNVIKNPIVNAVNNNKHTLFYKYSQVSEKSVTNVSDTKVGEGKVHNRRKNFVCDECDRTFTCSSHLNSHKEVVHRKGPTNEYFCGNCNFKTRFKNRIVRHLKSHATVCTVCNSRFSSQYDLTSHMRVHTGERPFSCDICNYKCKQKAHLKSHMLNVHIGEKQFSCDKCGYKCTQRSSLNVHMKKHTGEKPFSCGLCDYRCISKSYLSIHMRVHTGEKPFSCSTCDYKCANKCHLKRHMRVHTGEKPYSCTLCDYKSTQKGLLTEHMRTHTGEKPYTCNICGHTSAQKSSMNDHMISHSTHKPFSCEICGIKLSRPGCLKRHLWNKHKIKKPK